MANVIANLHYVPSLLRPSADIGRLCRGGAVVIAVQYCHVEVLGSIPGEGEIFMEYAISAECPVHSAVVNIDRVFSWSTVRRRGRDWPSSS